ncbi:MAG: helix-turn-helix transcriptional regulator [Oligoflexia bacterium]|nr:helix-turn-helix transcriptional regulator [Oligoflexia bacterium]
MQTRLHILRAERRITQEELAEEIGVTRGTIIAIEKGNYNPTLELAFKLSFFFDTSIENIFLIERENEKDK